MNQSKKVAKSINSYLKRKDIQDQLYTEAVNINQVKDYIGEIIKYYVLTRDTDITLDLKDVVERSRAIQSLSDGYFKDDKFVEYSYDKEEVRQNATSNGFVTHSFNSYIKNKVKRYGLRNSKTRDEELSKDLEYLETKLGESVFLKNQEVSNPKEIYIAAPGQASVHYATNMNPERLYLGPLFQYRHSAIPIRIGENKKDYLMKVAYKKAKVNCPTEDFETVIESYRNVIDKLANPTACIALIPIESSKYDLKIAYSAGNPQERKYTSPERYYSSMATNGLFLSNEFGNCGQLNDGVTVGETIPGTEIGIIELMDEFEMKQAFARKRGLKEGDYIDYFTGEEVVNYKEEPIDSKLMIINNNNLFKKIIQNLRLRFTKKTGVEQNTETTTKTDNHLDKASIKSAFMSIRNSENEAIINNILGEIDLNDEATLLLMFQQTENLEEKAKRLVESKLAEQKNNVECKKSFDNTQVLSNTYIDEKEDDTIK